MKGGEMECEGVYPKKGIHRYVAEYIQSLPDLTGKRVLDIPCGDGRASYEFLKRGADVVSVDIFPEFYKINGVNPIYGDLRKKIPIDDNSIDYIVCQEGIEHIPDQIHVISEFNRVLKEGGVLLLTTPNYSNVRSKISHLFLESDFWKRMPPTVLDSVWFSGGRPDDVYFGHLFLIGVQKLQTFLDLYGFVVEKRIKTDLSSTSILVGFPLYPATVFLNFFALISYKKHLLQYDSRIVSDVFWERLKLNLSYKTLFCKHIFWVIRKEYSLEKIHERMNGWVRGVE